MIRVLVADDQPVVRSGLRAFLDYVDDIEVVGEAESGAQVLVRVDECEPDVVLMDIEMPGGDGLTATRALRSRERPVAVVVLTSFQTDDHVFGALEAGAGAFLLKTSGSDDLADTIRAVAAGESRISPAVLHRVIAEFARRKVTPDPSLGSTVTSRERDVLRALARGLSNAEIADELSLAEGTVKTHLNNLAGKLGVRGRVGLAVWALRHGIAS